MTAGKSPQRQTYEPDCELQRDDCQGHKDTSLAERIRMLFREQGITITSIPMAIGMAISVLVEALLPGGTGGTAGEPPPKDEKGVKK